VSKLESLKELSDNWNGYGSARPNGTAIEAAREVLERLDEFGLKPVNVAASAEGGIGISFRRGARHALIECYNAGDRAGVCWEPSGPPQAWDIGRTDDELMDAIERIHDYLSAARPG
jgi:hypothetical protein